MECLQRVGMRPSVKLQRLSAQAEISCRTTLALNDCLWVLFFPRMDFACRVLAACLESSVCWNAALLILIFMRK